MGDVSPAQIKFKEAIRAILKNQSIQVTMFWKGRVALYAILKAMNIQPGAEVILPAFTCVVVPNPIIYLGGIPIYVDIDPYTYNIDAGKINSKITKKTQFILAQNTYGLSSDFDSINDIARSHEVRVIEDCAHGFGGSYKGRPNGTIAEAAFYSTQWNKPFTTGLGGIAVTSNQHIAAQLADMENGFKQPSFLEVVLLKILVLCRTYLLTPQTYWTGLRLYRWLSKYNLILGSSQGKEMERPVKPINFEKGFSEYQAQRGLKELNNFKTIFQHRKKIASHYDKLLCVLGIETPHVPPYAEHGYLKYPLLVKDRKALFTKAMESRIELGDWFLSPIHPVNSNYEYWNYHWGENPVAEKISQHVINLPTHLGVDNDYIEKIEKFLRKNRDNIFDSVSDCLKSK